MSDKWCTNWRILCFINYKLFNQNCNINFSQTGGNVTTNCCILGGDAEMIIQLMYVILMHHLNAKSIAR